MNLVGSDTMGQRKTRSAISAYKGNLIRARRRARSGNIERAIEAYDEVIGEIIHIGHEQITAQPMILRDLQDTVERILELLRWTQDYDRALSLLDRVKQDVPQMAGLFDADEALLLISAGRADEGFARLRAMTEAEPTNIWLWCLLGSEYAALELYPEAENCLRTAVGIADAPASDRAAPGCYSISTADNAMPTRRPRPGLKRVKRIHLSRLSSPKYAAHTSSCGALIKPWSF